MCLLVLPGGSSREGGRDAARKGGKTSERVKEGKPEEDHIIEAFKELASGS